MRQSEQKCFRSFHRPIVYARHAQSSKIILYQIKIVISPQHSLFDQLSSPESSCIRKQVPVGTTMRPWWMMVMDDDGTSDEQCHLPIMTKLKGSKIWKEHTLFNMKVCIYNMYLHEPRNEHHKQNKDDKSISIKVE